MALSPWRLLPRVREVDRVRHATEMHHSVGLVPAPTPPHSRRAGRCGNSSGATGVGFGLTRPVDGPPETALNGEAFVSRRRKPLRASRSEPPTCMRGSLSTRLLHLKQGLWEASGEASWEASSGEWSLHQITWPTTGSSLRRVRLSPSCNKRRGGGPCQFCRRDFYEVGFA